MNEPNNLEPKNTEFASLLEESLLKGDNFSVGDKVTGKVVYITPETVFVDISGKSEAIIDATEFMDENGQMPLTRGDVINAYVASIKKGEIVLTSAIGRGIIAPELIDNARRENIPVEGTVAGLTNGGYRVTVSGIECFCPHSQIDIKSPPAPEEMLNRTFTFKVLQVSERGRNIVLSRRQLLQEKQEAREAELRSGLHEGDTVSGTVVSVQKFGLFVDLDGVEALVPRTEVSWSRNAALDIFKPGERITARVITLNWKEKRIVLSIKQTESGPWEKITLYSTGQQVNGTVTNIIRNGAFVEIEPGLEGFIPISRMSPVKRVNKPEDAVAVGDSVMVRIMEINPADKKMSLELLTDEPDPWQESTPDITDTLFTAVIESIRANGIYARLPNGMAGFIPREECALKKGMELQNAYSAGGEVKVVVKQIDKENRRLKLSEAGALKREERMEFEQFMNSDQSPQQEGSNFGMLFKQKFDEMKNRNEKNK